MSLSEGSSAEAYVLSEVRGSALAGLLAYDLAPWNSIYIYTYTCVCVIIGVTILYPPSYHIHSPLYSTIFIFLLGDISHDLPAVSHQLTIHYLPWYASLNHHFSSHYIYVYECWWLLYECWRLLLFIYPKLLSTSTIIPFHRSLVRAPVRIGYVALESLISGGWCL